MNRELDSLRQLILVGLVVASPAGSIDLGKLWFNLVGGRDLGILGERRATNLAGTCRLRLAVRDPAERKTDILIREGRLGAGRGTAATGR
jgi:hypothetical protein